MSHLFVAKMYNLFAARSQVKHPGPRTQNSEVLPFKQKMFLKVRSQNILAIPFCIIFRGEQLSEKWSPDEWGPILRKSGSSDIWSSGFYLFENHGIWFETGPYGSAWAHINTGPSPMAQDHFQPLLTPKKFIRIKNKKRLKDVKATQSAALNF